MSASPGCGADWRRLGLLAGFAALVGFLAFIYLGVPLLPKQSDSAWYYAGTHYIETGNYVWESFYPSFEGPSQYYPLGGYSLIILAARGVASVIGADWVAVLRVMQFTAYVLTGSLVYAIATLLSGRRTGAAAALLYFASFPFLNYAALVMSENMACLLITAFTFLFLYGLAHDRRWPVYLSFFLAGYTVLLKTVLLGVLPLLLAAAVIYDWKARRWGHWALLLAALAACPAAQSITNRFIYGNYRIVSGLGLHLCDRILLADKSIPVDLQWPLGAGRAEYVPVELAMSQGSPALRRLAKELQSRAPRYIAVNSGRLAKQLVFMGYPREQIEPTRQAVATDLLATRDVKFVPIDTAIASGSPAFRRLAQDLQQRRLQFIALGTWWDLGEQLSPLGYTMNQVEEFCWNISVDALKENKTKYVFNTFAMATKVLFREKELYPTRVYRTYREDFAWLAAFDDEPMQRPLGEALLRSQEGMFDSDDSGHPPLDLYNGFSDAFMKVQAFGLQTLIAGSYLMWSLVIIAQTIGRRQRRQLLPLAVVLLPALVVLGSCATEVLEARYRLPVQPLLIVACCLLIADGSSRVARRLRPERPPSSPI